MPAVAPSGAQRQGGVDKLAKLKQVAAQFPVDDDEETTTDDSSDEAEAALEMDGQELWAQNYCATCDCLIEPGQGVEKQETKGGAAMEASNSSSSISGLRSKSGTIKARQSSESKDGDRPKDTAVFAANLKRTHSAGKLHAKGGSTFGPQKRTGSAAGRLNALSDLKPTTKLNADTDKGKGPAAAANNNSNNNNTVEGKGRKSPALSRRGSTASAKSSNQSSGPSSPTSTGAVANQPQSLGRSKRAALLSALTPAALQQQDEMTSRRQGPAALYCSERCRLIDERRSSGLVELTQYISQPQVPQAPVAWASPGWPPANMAAVPVWPRSTSMQYVVGTPESECMCPECIDKYAEGGSAGGATVPSGASDTTESSSGYFYSQHGPGPKRRTASGRIMTPLNLHAPSSGSDGYFPTIAPQAQPRRTATSSPKPRYGQPSAVSANTTANQQGSNVAPPPRTSSAASGGAGPVGSASTGCTEGSLVSSSSGGSLWEPKLRRPSSSSPGRANPTTNSVKRSTSPRENGSRARSSTHSSMSEQTAGGMTSSGTNTPAHQTLRGSVSSSSSSTTRRQASQSYRLSAPAFTPVTEIVPVNHSSEAQEPKVGGSMGSSYQSSGTSPLRLLDRSSRHYAAPSVDLSSEQARSPGGAPPAGLLSRSLASEQTVLGTSSTTIDGRLGGNHHQSRHGKSGSSALATSDDLSSVVEVPSPRADGDQPSDHYEPVFHHSTSAGSLAVGSLKMAQTRAARPPIQDQRAEVHHRIGSESAASMSADGRDRRRLSLVGTSSLRPNLRRSSEASRPRAGSSSSFSSGWLKSLSSAWNSLRGWPSGMQPSGDIESVAVDADEDWYDDRQAQFDQLSLRNNDSTAPSASMRPYVRGTGSRRPRSSRSEQSQFSLSPPGDLHSQRSDSPASAALSNALAAASIADGKDGPTPTQSLVAKPTIRRGSIPAYAKEVGKGEIPGELDTFTNDYESPVRGRSDSVSGHSIATISEEERRRRRLEKERLNKIRRSKDVHVLPPLLAPSSRQASSTNLHGVMTRQPRTASHGRTRTQSGTQLYVGSAGSSSHGALPTRPTTPGLSYAANAPPSPSLVRSPLAPAFGHAGTAVVASPSRPGSAAGYYSNPTSAGTSPRTKGLGWGVMTQMAPPPPFAPTPQQSAEVLRHTYAHGHSSSLNFGHTSAMAARNAHAASHAVVHRHHYHGGHAPAPGRIVHQSRQSTGGALQLGHVGLLGTHPHGHAPVPGRHSTMPSTINRTPTPSVPEDGGEMTSDALTSGEFIHRPNSAMANGQHRHRSFHAPPRSRSSMGMRAMNASTLIDSAAMPPPSGFPVTGDVPNTAAATAVLHHPEPSNRTWSYEALPGLKTYPVLQLPDRETHDRYDEGWGLGEGGLSKHLTGRKIDEGLNDQNRAAQGQGRESNHHPAAPHRKKLFYFDS
ncbi:hypothetical protein IE53DRAFT_272947 [Violaceomyces palustris]|uniref:Uncharacterized protein n=1 Tax=Violaceomyces palustris TaxID=1673888 RepID=A0ACD0P3I8_9BASI|nr:hypothetical protein IE53DRAFT_272947 [Violaceomyces palustris]